MIAALPQTDRLTFVCPECGDQLRVISEGVLSCSADRTSYKQVDGVWHLVAPSRTHHFVRFVEEYDSVRRMEGRWSEDPAYFEALPFEDLTGTHRFDWNIRAHSFECFVKRVLRDAERRNEDRLRDAERRESDRLRDAVRLRVLDLGCGNGWLSNRLAQRGHDVFAVDLRIGPHDGLGAHAHYRSTFTSVRAEFDRLPFEKTSFDLVVFNASLHYSENYERTLLEALRVLRADGRIVIIDTPIYDDESSGVQMVRDRTRRFREAYGVTSDALASEEFVTERRLRQLAVRLGITWETFKPRYGIRWTLRRAVARVRNWREPARFAVIVGRTQLGADAAIGHMTPSKNRQRAGRAALQLRKTLAKSTLNRETGVRIADLRFRIPPGVFNPVLFRSGAFLAEVIRDDVLPKGARVLDLGSGSGVLAISAASMGCDAAAVDINPNAVTATFRNASMNGVDVSCLQGDLFASAGSFDVVLFNPPYFSGRPQTPFDLAWRSDDVVDRFSARLTQHLTPSGFALVVLSSDGCCGEYLRRFESDGHRIARVAERRFLNETLTVFRLR